jgi:acetyl-CoA synthetase
MRLEYKSFEEAQRNFNWSERWKVFDKNRENLNITHECIDRHPKNNIAIRLKFDNRKREVYTFGEISRRTSQLANMLERYGINPGDRVAIVLNPSLEYYVSFYGVLKRGAVAVPTYVLLGPEGIEYRLKESNTKMVIMNRDRANLIPPDLCPQQLFAEDLWDLIEAEDEDYVSHTSAESLAVIQFSSGTTGQPKQVLYKHGTIAVTAVYVRFWIGLRDGDRYMCTSSPAWGHGIWYGTVGPVIFGNGIGAYSGKFDPAIFLEALEEFKIMVVSAIPRVYRMIMDCGKFDDYQLKLRELSYTGSVMGREVLQYFQEKTGLIVRSTYGNTEVGPIAIDYAFDDYQPRLGSAGKAMLRTKLGVIDNKGNELPPREVGELAVWRKDRWNPVGDSGYIDKDGYVWPLGRSDDVIKSSGFRIGPFEIEVTLEKHPAVDKAAVVGSPDKERGEIVKAFVISNKPPSEDLKREIQDFVKTQLSMHEYPREIEFVDQLPETPDGKIRRRELKELERARKLKAQ